MENLNTQKDSTEKQKSPKFRLIDLLYAKWKTNPYLPEGWLIAIPENPNEPIFIHDSSKGKFMYMERPLFKIRGELEFTETPSLDLVFFLSVSIMMMKKISIAKCM